MNEKRKQDFEDEREKKSEEDGGKEVKKMRKEAEDGDKTEKEKEKARDPCNILMYGAAEFAENWDEAVKAIQEDQDKNKAQEEECNKKEQIQVNQRVSAEEKVRSGNDE